jgi:hypothetical protein
MLTWHQHLACTGPKRLYRELLIPLYEHIQRQLSAQTYTFLVAATQGRALTISMCWMQTLSTGLYHMSLVKYLFH